MFIITYQFYFCCSINSRSKKIGKTAVGTRKTVSTLRCFKNVSDPKMNELKTRWLKKQTFNKMQWGVRTFREWRNDRLSSPETFDSTILEIDLDVVISISKQNLSYALCRFIPEVTKKKTVHLILVKFCTK